MKTARFILKIVAVSMAAAAIICATVAYWDKIMDVFYAIADKLEEKKADCCFDAEQSDFDEEFE